MELYVVFLLVKRETAPTPPPAPSKPALSEEELEKKSTAIIEEYLHINDMKVHRFFFGQPEQCVRCIGTNINTPNIYLTLVQ